MENASDLVQRARQIRQLRPIELSRISGVPASTLSRIERSSVDPSFGIVKKLLESMGFSGTDLQDDVDDSKIVEAIESNPSPEAMYDVYRVAGQVSPIRGRRGIRAVTADLDDVVNTLERASVSYGVSTLEGVCAGWPEGRTHSFWPVVYVDPGFRAPWPEQPAPAKRGTIYLAPMTPAAAGYVDEVNGVKFMAADWSIIDTVASPGRQSDVGLNRLRAITSRMQKADVAA